ncbi:MAG TPA: hypothetical protein VNK41_02075 [Vicinamibacterales bacterium]|nr:hypothetical protein [Vicinamibacterales bacterium]
MVIELTEDAELGRRAVLDLIEGDILRPTVVEPAVRMALDARGLL